MDGEAPEPAGKPGSVHPVDWTVQAGAVDDVLGALAVRLRRRRLRRVRILAAAALGLATTGLVWRLGAAKTPAAGSPVSSSAVLLVPRRELLPDGSSIELRLGAEIAILFSPASRRVILKRGEALFTVAKDARRPFLVEAQGLQVRAVGTAFTVSLGHESVEVLVTEGRVAVDAASGGAPAAAALESGARTLAFIDAGNRAVLDTSRASSRSSLPRVSAVSAAEVATHLAWEVPRLQFSSTPLSEAIALFNQHSAVKLILANPALGSIHLSGVIRADNVDTLIALLREQSGIRAETHGDHEIILRPAQ